MDLQQLVNRRAIVAAIVIAVSAALALALGATYGASNQLTYMLGPLRQAHPELYGRDWLVATTTQYHPVFTWLAAPLYAIDPRGRVAFGIAQLVVMSATWGVLYRMLGVLAVRARLAMFVLIVGLLATGGGRALAGTYLFAGYIQPSSLATLGWMIAMVAWLRDRPLAAGVTLGLAGACHINFLVLGIGLFAMVELSSRRLDVRRLAALLGPSLVVLAAFAPALIASMRADDTETALRLLVKFHAPGHYDPARIRRGLPALLGWLAVAWAALPIARTAGKDAVDRMWRFAAVATALCAAATAIVAIPPLLGVTRLFVWRIAPFAQLASQLLVVVAALAPTTVALSSRRSAVLVLGALVVIVAAIQTAGGQHLYVYALCLLAAVWVSARWLRIRALAVTLAVVTCGLVPALQRHELIDPSLFAPTCGGSDCELLRWARTETAVDAVFLVPPYLNWFRLLGERAIVADTKSPPLYPDELVAWYRRLCAIVDAPEMPTHEAVEARWDVLTGDQILAAGHRFEVDYVLIDKVRSTARLSAPVAFETPDRVVYRLR